MSSLLMALIAIAGICGPRVQSGGAVSPQETAKQAKICQIELLKCAQSKGGSIDTGLAQCISEGK
jgi:hypothetical protein